MVPCAGHKVRAGCQQPEVRAAGCQQPSEAPPAAATIPGTAGRGLRDNDVQMILGHSAGCQRSKGIRQWPINSSTSTMLKHKITPS